MKKKYFNKDFPTLLHGADYNPEQWVDTKEIWDEDMRLMKLASVNEASVGIFSWSVLEPRENEYHFEIFDEILDKIYNNGGRYSFCTRLLRAHSSKGWGRGARILRKRFLRR